MHNNKANWRDSDPHVLLTPREMAECDRLAVAAGMPSYTLMKRAGREVAKAVLRYLPHAGQVLIVCGAGNNGGDGYVAAADLARAGLAVCVAQDGDPSQLGRDAALAHADWHGERRAFTACDLTSYDVIIDALFGAGLNRPVAGEAAHTISAINGSGVPVVAIDLPSGINGATGAQLGISVKAAMTVTFFRQKPGHVLFPGRERAGIVHVADIGIGPETLDRQELRTWVNKPGLWAGAMPCPAPDAHKYRHGHVAVFSGPASATGAARLAAAAAARAGAGVVSIFSRSSAIMANAAQTTAIMVKRYEPGDIIAERLSDLRVSAVVIGPAFGTGEAEAAIVRDVLAWVGARPGRSLILDADALTGLASRPELVPECPGENCIMTPHDGEFARLFPDLKGDRLTRARAASKRCGGVVVLKGADSVIAAPDGRAAISANAPSWLATAGSGDTLAGIIAALAGRGMPSFEAACAGVWLHGEAGRIAGPAMTADDLEAAVGTARCELLQDG